jgi:uncharacterized RDD family membrane protein YckC
MSTSGGISLAKSSEGYDPIPPIEDLPEPAAYATGWQRFWSKNFDIITLSLGVGAAFAVLFPDTFLSQIESDPSGRLLGIMLLPVVFVVDALILVLFGNTLGRALIGIRVENVDHSRPGIGTALGRGMRVWCFGCALGIPIAAIATYKVNFDKVSRGDQTSWDEHLGTRVRQVAAGIGRTWLTAVAAILVMAASLALDAGEKMPASTDGEAATADLSSYGDTSAPAPDPIEKELQKVADELKPAMVDEITRLDGARVDGRHITYDYTIIRRDGSDTAIRKYIRTTVRKNMCNNKDLAELMKDYGVVFEHSYSLPNADEPISEEIAWADCSG